MALLSPLRPPPKIMEMLERSMWFIVLKTTIYIFFDSTSVNRSGEFRVTCSINLQGKVLDDPEIVNQVKERYKLKTYIGKLCFLRYTATNLGVHMRSKVIAVILSAGMGTRLKPLTLKIPKPLIKIGGKPIILHQLQAMKEIGIDNVVVVLGYKSSMVIDVLEKTNLKQYATIIENKEYKNTNNIYSLYLAINYLRNNIQLDKYTKLILMNGDTIFDKTILEDMLLEKGNRIAVDIGNFYEDSMKVIVDDNKNIKYISKLIHKTESYGVSINLFTFDIKTLYSFESTIKNMVENEALMNVWFETALERLFDDQYIFRPLDVKNRYWFEIDTFEDLKEAERLFNIFQNGKELMDKKLFIFDLYGTVILGNVVLPYVKEFLDLLLKRNKSIVFITNNSSMSKQEHLERLQSLLGVELHNKNLYTSVEDTINYLNSKNIQKIFLLATPSVTNEFKNNGFIVDSEDVNAVVVAFDKCLSYKKLETASLLLENNENIQFILVNKDLKCPTELGFIPDAGSIAKLLEATTNRKVDVFRGKPNPEMITNIIAKYQFQINECVFFGDRLYTDITMSDKSGIITVLMLTGETKMHELELSFLEKHLVLRDFQELLKILAKKDD